MTNTEYRKSMGMDMPTPERNLATERYTVRKVEPPKEEEPSTVPTIFGDEDYEGVVICLADSEGGEPD